MSKAKRLYNEQVRCLDYPVDRWVVKGYIKELHDERGILIYTIVFLLFVLIIK